MAPQSATRVAPRQASTEDLDFLKANDIEATGIREVDQAVAKYARRMGGQTEAILNYKDAMLQRYQAQG